MVASRQGNYKYHVIVFRPGASDWESISETDIFGNRIRISPDSSLIVATESLPGKSAPRIWREETGWSAVDGIPLSSALATSLSSDGTSIGGYGRDGLQPFMYAWTWNQEKGATVFPLLDGRQGVYTVATSNDGSIIAGNTTYMSPSGTPHPIANRQKAGEPPSVIKDSNGIEMGSTGPCNHDCSIVFGTGQSGFQPADQNSRKVWYWKSTHGTVTYLDYPEGIMEDPTNRTVASTTADGSMLVGSYLLAGSNTSDPFLWTQNTGMISLFEIMREMGIETWESGHSPAISPDGTKILISGHYDLPGYNTSRQYKAFVMKLHPKPQHDKK